MGFPGQDHDSDDYPVESLVARNRGGKVRAFLLRVAGNALALWLAAELIRGISVSGVGPALVAGLLLALVNALIRPVLLILTLPLNILTLGLFTFVLNGILLYLVANQVTGVAIAGLGSAVLAALLVSLVSWVLSSLVR